MDFPNDESLARLVEFARTQQSQVERQTLFSKATERIITLSAANRFQDAAQAAQEALKIFPGNKDLLLLQQQAELQDRKYQTRKAIEQRIRDIKVKINREKFSEAIELAQQTLVTLGPSTAVTQLLSSAKVEFKARERKRKQEKELESVRTLVEDGKLDQATETLQRALKTEALDTFDPRVARVSDEIDSARGRSRVPPASGPEPPPAGPGLSKEYAWQMGPPAHPDLIEPNTQTQLASPQASAFPPAISEPPAAPPPPPVVEITPPARVEPVKPSVVQPAAAIRPPVVEVPPQREAEPVKPVVKKTSTPAAPPPRPVAQASVTPLSSVPAKPPVAKAPPRAPVSSHPVSVPAPEPERISQQIPLWRRPAAVAITSIVLIILWGAVHFLSTNREKEAVLITSSKPVPTVQTQVNPLELQQRQAMDRADKNRAAGNLEAASQALKDATSVNGPLNGEIQKKLDEVQSEMNDAVLAQARRKEEQLWQQAKTDVDRGRFEAAKEALEQIRQLPQGQGTRREDAQTYLDQVIPRRQHEEDLLAKVKQDISKTDRNSLSEALTLSDQIIQLGGPRKADAERLKQSAQTALSALGKQELAQQISGLEAGARLDLKQGNFPAARDKVAKIRVAGGDTASLSAEIDKAEAAAQARQQDDVNYQQAVQKYKQAQATNDKSGIDAARDSFMWIAQNGGPHATEARKYVSEINERNTTSQLAPPPSPVANQKAPSTEALDEDALRAVINLYEQAFQQRNADAMRLIWPSMGKKYGKYKNAFAGLKNGAFNYRAQVQSIKISSDSVSAVVKAVVYQDYAPRGEKMQSSSDQVVFELSKSSGSWLITDVK